MSKLIVNNIVSLDGHYADRDGNPLVLEMDAAFDRANLETIRSASMVLLGRDSFEGFSAYWPFVVDAPAPDDPHAPEARRVSAVNREISQHYNRLPKVVISNRGAIDPANAWAHSTRVVSRDAAAAWIRDAKRQAAADIVMFGSRQTWNALLPFGVIDELHLMVSPRALGAGVPLFTGPCELELLEARRFEDSSNVQLRYRVLV